MIRLDTTTRTLKAVLAGAITTTELDIAVGFADKGTAYVQGSHLIAANGTTPVTICAAPASSVVRNIDFLSVRNRDTVQVVITISIDDNGTLFNLIQATLETGELLGYTHSAGWYVCTSDGSKKSGAVQDLSGYQLLTSKDATGGYVGLTGFSHNFKNVLGTVVSLLTNSATAIRTYTFPDKSGTVAMTSDITAAAVGLGNVDNTSDASKPVSTAQQTALDLKANLAGPSFTGIPAAPTAAAATNTTQLATTAFVHTEVANAVTGLLHYQGATDCSTNPNYPAAVKGDSYIVSVAGKIGGASGTSVDIGDWYIATADNAGGTEASVGTSWGHMEHNLVGALLASNNLSDLTDASAARSSLGLGSLAVLSAAPAGTLTGATLAAGVTASSLTSVGTLTGGATGTGFTVALGTSTITGILGSANGGTGSGFTKFTGPTTAEKTFTLPNASATLLYDGGALGTPSSGTLTNCTFPTLNQNTSGSAASLSISGQTGLLTFSGLASTSRIKTVRDAADTILELGGSYTPTGTWTSLTMVTPVLGTPTSGTLTNCTGLPAAGVVGTAAVLGANVFTGTQQLASGTSLNWNNDTFLTRRAAASVQHGDADSATPVAQTIAFQGSRGGTDTNVAAVAATIQGSLGTGTGTVGNLVFSTGTVAASGTTQHTAAARLTLNSASAAFTVPLISLPASGQILGPSNQIDIGASTTTLLRCGTSTYSFFVSGTAEGFVAAALMAVKATGFFGFSSTSAASGSVDAAFARNASNVIEVNTGTAGTYADIIARRHITAPSSANGQSLGLKCLTELTTIAAAATTDTAIQMPAGAIVLAVSVRVTTAITCTSTFTVGDSGSATRFGTGLSKAVNTTNAGTVAPYVNSSALSVRITPDSTPSDATGRVRVTIYYFEATVPTS